MFDQYNLIAAPLSAGRETEEPRAHYEFLITDQQTLQALHNQLDHPTKGSARRMVLGKIKSTLMGLSGNHRAQMHYMDQPLPTPHPSQNQTGEFKPVYVYGDLTGVEAMIALKIMRAKNDQIDVTPLAKRILNQM